MKRFLILGMILTYATAAWAQANNANPYSIAGGLYYLDQSSNPQVPTPFPNNLTGYTARIYWKNIEPSDGSYTWTQNDNLFSQLPVGKVMALNNLPGVHSLDWALDKYEADGIGSFSSIWSAPYNAPNQNTNNNPNHAIVPCAVFEFPIPWDTTYQHDISNMVTALAGHIATLSNNSALVRIGATPISTETAEMDLMTRTTATAITCGAGVNNSICGNNPSTCTPPLDTAAWQAVGYTPNKLRAAWDTMLSDWTRNFPQIVVSAAMPGGLFPPIDNNGNNTARDRTVQLRIPWRLMVSSLLRTSLSRITLQCIHLGQPTRSRRLYRAVWWVPGSTRQHRQLQPYDELFSAKRFQLFGSL